MFRRLCEEHGWLPSDIAKLTYYQVRMVICEESQITGKRKVSGEVGRALLKRGPKRKEKKFLKRFFGGGK